MANFFQRLFSGTDSSSKVSWGPRSESIQYRTENKYLEIASTFMYGRRIYTDSIKNWQDGKLIEQHEKGEIFKDVLLFLKRQKDSPVVEINTDYDKEFWDALCKENKGSIKGIEYSSQKQKEEFRYNNMLNTIQHNGTVVIGERTIKTEAELKDYWENRNK